MNNAQAKQRNSSVERREAILWPISIIVFSLRKCKFNTLSYQYSCRLLTESWHHCKLCSQRNAPCRSLGARFFFFCWETKKCHCKLKTTEAYLSSQIKIRESFQIDRTQSNLYAIDGECMQCARFPLYKLKWIINENVNKPKLSSRAARTNKALRFQWMTKSTMSARKKRFVSWINAFSRSQFVSIVCSRKVEVLLPKWSTDYKRWTQVNGLENLQFDQNY